MKKILIYISLIFCTISCEIPFEIKDKADPLVFVQCAPSNEDTTFFKMVYASPIGSGAQKVDLLPSMISMDCNGKALKIEKKGNLWFILHQFAPGEKVSMRIEGAALKTATCSVFIPEKPIMPDVKFSHKKNKKSSYTEFKLIMKEPVERGVYYGMQIYRKNKLRLGEGEGSMEIEDDLMLSPNPLSGISDVRDIDMDDYCSVNFFKGIIDKGYTAPMSLLTYRQFKDGVYTFYISENLFSMLEIPEHEELPENKVTIIESRIKIRFYRLSNEFYYYAKAQFLSNFDILANMGLIPANFTYTNVENGLGNLGGLSYVETDWMLLEKEK